MTEGMIGLIYTHLCLNFSFHHFTLLYCNKVSIHLLYYIAQYMRNTVLHFRHQQSFWLVMIETTDLFGFLPTHKGFNKYFLVQLKVEHFKG